MLKFAAAFLVLALSATAAWAETAPALSKADTDAYFAISSRHFDSRSGFSKQQTEIVRVRPVDEAKLCTVHHGMVADIMAEKAEKLAFLHRLEQENKPIETLIGSFLSTSDLADTFAKSESEYCANAQVAAEKHDKDERSIWESVYLAEALLGRMDKVRTSYAAAVKSKDRLVSLSDLQTEAAFLDEIVFHIKLLRDHVQGSHPRITALTKRLPALEAELADVTKRNKAEVTPYKK